MKDSWSWPRSKTSACASWCRCRVWGIDQTPAPQGRSTSRQQSQWMKSQAWLPPTQPWVGSQIQISSKTWLSTLALESQGFLSSRSTWTSTSVASRESLDLGCCSRTCSIFDWLGRTGSCCPEAATGCHQSSTIQSRSVLRTALGICTLRWTDQYCGGLILYRTRHHQWTLSQCSWNAGSDSLHRTWWCPHSSLCGSTATAGPPQSQPHLHPLLSLSVGSWPWRRTKCQEVLLDC